MAPINRSDIPDRLTVDAFWDLFGAIEHEELDFKKGVADSILETIPAMAMTGGGIIVHGVTDDREIVGCPRSQNTVDRITQRAHECGVEVHIQPMVVGEYSLLSDQTYCYLSPRCLYVSLSGNTKTSLPKPLSEVNR